MAVHLDIGGEGRHFAAWNINPGRLTTTTGAPGRPIPQLVLARGEALPIASRSVDLVTVENAPLRPAIVDEIARVLRPGGEVRLLHPVDYAIGDGMHDAVAGVLRIASRTGELVPDGIWSTVLRTIR